MHMQMSIHEVLNSTRVIKFYDDIHIDDNKPMLYDNRKSWKPLHYHTLNPIIDELDFKTDLGWGTITLHIYMKNWGAHIDVEKCVLVS